MNKATKEMNKIAKRAKARKAVEYWHKLALQIIADAEKRKAANNG